MGSEHFIKSFLKSTVVVITLTLTFAVLIQDRLIYIKRSYKQFNQEYTELIGGFEKEYGKVQELPQLDEETGEQHFNYLVINPALKTSMKKNKKKKLVVMLGGNAMLALDWLFMLKRIFFLSDEEKLSEQNYHFLLIEYPGYGKSYDAAVDTNMNTVLKAIDGGVKNAINSLGGLSEIESISSLTHSLGCASILHYFSTTNSNNSIPKMERIILISPFTKLSEVALSLFVPFSMNFIEHANIDALIKAQNQWNNLEAITNLLEKKTNSNEFIEITIIHGDRDEIVDYRLGKKLYEHVEKEVVKKKQKNNNNVGGVTTKFITVRGGDHNAIFESGMRDVLHTLRLFPNVKTNNL